MKLSKTSYPKEKIRILLLENIADNAVNAFRENGYIAIERISSALSEKELMEKIGTVHILGIRSKTQVTASVIRKAKKLIAIGCYCIGVNQVDLKEAEKWGIAVFNAPHANTRSVAELVIGLSIMLIRKVPEKNAAAHRGIWQKDARNSFELRGKTMGIVGYGNIGSQVGILAESMGMRVLFYDTETKLALGNAEPVSSLKQLLRRSHIISLHVPGLPSTQQLIDKPQLEEIRRGALLINLSRGDVVDIPALKSALDSGMISGAALDVFPEEPEKNGEAFHSIFQPYDQVILTPHIGGSTEEAQTHIGEDVSSKLLMFLERGTSIGSFSVPPLNLTINAQTHRLLHIHQNKPGVLGKMNSVLSAFGINISAQYLKTNDQIGYVVIDTDSPVTAEAVKRIKLIPGSIKTRILY